MWECDKLTALVGNEFILELWGPRNGKNGSKGKGEEEEEVLIPSVFTVL